MEDRMQIMEKYSDLIIETGLNLQPGQRLFIWANQLELAPLVRQVVKRAYQQGSPLVSVLWNDDQVQKVRFEHAPRGSFDEFPSWKSDARFKSVEAGDAVIWMGGDNPDLLKDYAPELVSAAAGAYSRYMKPFLDKIASNAVQWLVICPPTPGWSQVVFPDRDIPAGEKRLWDAVIKACRLDVLDPAGSWKENLDKLERRAAYLTDRQFRQLHFTGPGTDLKVGLPEKHIWIGGWDRTPGGIKFCANLPTEEVYTLPHKEQVDGTVRATRPLSCRGGLIEGFQMTFEAGKVVDYSAVRGEELLRDLLDTDPGSSYLGEVALVPNSCPISRQELIFFNTLYDENASNHLALGNAYRVNLEDGPAMSVEEFSNSGGNESTIHEDFMFGSGAVNVEGLLHDGSSEMVMREGEWAFES